MSTQKHKRKFKTGIMPGRFVGFAFQVLSCCVRDQIPELPLTTIKVKK